MAAIFHGIMLFSSLFSIATAQSRLTNISFNSALSPTTNPTSWLSPSGYFAIGFYPQGTGFAVGIWLVGPSGERIIIWTANRDDSPVSANSSLLLRPNGGLVLRSDGKDKTISDIAESASFASMLDSGNFLLYNSDSEIIWRTFDSPTDTILGGQRLSAGKALISSGSETNRTSGRFQMVMQTDGNLVFYPTQGPTAPEDAYWASSTRGRGDNVTLNLDDNGFLYLLNSTGSYILNLTQGFDARIQSTTTNIYRATLGVDGVFRLYLYRFEKGGNSTQLMIWSSTSQICEVKGLCGLNSYCVLNDTQPNCRCPPGFRFVDPSQQSLGCDRSFTAKDCIAKKEDVKYDMFNMSNTEWKNDPYAISSSVSEEGCRKECLQDCRCEAALFKDRSCYKQKLPLQYWRRKSDISATAFVKYGDGNGDPGSPNDGVKPGADKSKRKKLILGTTAGVGIFLLTCFLVSSICLVRKFPSDKFFFWKMKANDTQNVEEFLENYGSLIPKRYQYSELKKMTNSFKDNLGQGGYGSVFKGKLNDGRLIAVKVLNNLKGSKGVDFINEVASVGTTNHVNVVTLLGFCSEGSKRALVYEFMSKGSLEKFIFSDKPGTGYALDCPKLFQIAVGIARGLEYLHRGCNTRIVHFDIKPHNILLDDDFSPKISDFGLAKLCCQQQSTLSMLDARGTIGYTAPEVFCRNIGGISHKSDVYSYGMVVLEMIGGRKNIDAKAENTSEIYFPHWVYKHIRLKESLRFLGFRTEAEEDIGRKMVLVGLWCIQTDPTNRPSMSRVLEMLEGSLESLEMPPKPCISSPPRSSSSTT